MGICRIKREGIAMGTIKPIVVGHEMLHSLPDRDIKQLLQALALPGKTFELTAYVQVVSKGAPGQANPHIEVVCDLEVGDVVTMTGFLPFLSGVIEKGGLDVITKGAWFGQDEQGVIPLPFRLDADPGLLGPMWEKPFEGVLSALVDMPTSVLDVLRELPQAQRVSKARELVSDHQAHWTYLHQEAEKAAILL